MADQVITSGFGNCFDESLEGPQFFAAAQLFTTVARTAGRRPTSAIVQFFSRLEIKVEADWGQSDRSLVLLPVTHRRTLLDAVGRLMKVTRLQFVGSALAVGVSQNALISSSALIPAPLYQVFKDLPERRKTTRHTALKRASGIRSRKSVLRMWARIQRDLGRVQPQWPE